MTDAAAVINRVLHAQTLYAVFGLDKTASLNDIKREYFKVSRLVHPDKCNLPRAKDAFQVLSNAYHILSDPVQRRRYDHTGRFGGHDHERSFSDVADQLLSEFWNGNFTNILMLVDILNASNPDWHLEKETVARFLETTRNTVKEVDEYIKIASGETIKLWELRTEFRQLRWLDLLGAALIGVRALKVPANVVLSVHSRKPISWLFVTLAARLLLWTLEKLDSFLLTARAFLRPLWLIGESFLVLPILLWAWAVASAIFVLIWRVVQVPLALGRSVGLRSS